MATIRYHPPIHIRCTAYCPWREWALRSFGSSLRPTIVNFVCALCAAVSSCLLPAELLEPRSETFPTFFYGEHFWACRAGNFLSCLGPFRGQRPDRGAGVSWCAFAARGPP